MRDRAVCCRVRAFFRPRFRIRHEQKNVRKRKVILYLHEHTGREDHRGAIDTLEMEQRLLSLVASGPLRGPAGEEVPQEGVPAPRQARGRADWPAGTRVPEGLLRRQSSQIGRAGCCNLEASRSGKHAGVSASRGPLTMYQGYALRKAQVVPICQRPVHKVSPRRPFSTVHIGVHQCVVIRARKCQRTGAQRYDKKR